MAPAILVGAFLFNYIKDLTARISHSQILLRKVTLLLHNSNLLTFRQYPLYRLKRYRSS